MIQSTFSLMWFPCMCLFFLQYFPGFNDVLGKCRFLVASIPFQQCSQRIEMWFNHLWKLCFHSEKQAPPPPGFFVYIYVRDEQLPSCFGVTWDYDSGTWKWSQKSEKKNTWHFFVTFLGRLGDPKSQVKWPIQLFGNQMVTAGIAW